MSYRILIFLLLIVTTLSFPSFHWNYFSRRRFINSEESVEFFFAFFRHGASDWIFKLTSYFQSRRLIFSSERADERWNERSMATRRTARKEERTMTAALWCHETRLKISTPLAMDYRRVRTSEGVLNEVYFFAYSRCARNIWIYYAYYVFFRMSTIMIGERTVDES